VLAQENKPTNDRIFAPWSEEICVGTKREEKREHEDEEDDDDGKRAAFFAHRL